MGCFVPVLIFLWLLSFHQEKESDKLPRREVNKSKRVFERLVLRYNDILAYCLNKNLLWLLSPFCLLRKLCVSHVIPLFWLPGLRIRNDNRSCCSRNDTPTMLPIYLLHVGFLYHDYEDSNNRSSQYQTPDT
jgi:hypothetical protein